MTIFKMAVVNFLHKILQKLDPKSSYGDKQFVFTRDSIYAIARICYRSSVRPFVRWVYVYHRKTVEVRMMTCSPYVAPSL